MDRQGSDELPTFSPRMFAGFARYLRRYFARHFNAVRLASERPDPSTLAGPVVAYANHPSWWDPIFLMLLHARWFPGRPGYGPIDADMLAKYRLFARLGLFGVEPGTMRGAATFLRTGRAILAREDAVLWVTAQGRFADPRERPLDLAPGLAHLLARGATATVVPVAIEYPFWTERKPEALVLVGEPIRPDRCPGDDPSSWTALLDERLTEAMDRLGSESARRERARFEVIVRGGSGVGGVYDVGRRFRAWLRGERFDASHSNRE